jgi:hypothetical protein
MMEKVASGVGVAGDRKVKWLFDIVNRLEAG